MFTIFLERRRLSHDIPSSEPGSLLDKINGHGRSGLIKLRPKYAIDTSTKGKNRLFILRAGTVEVISIRFSERSQLLPLVFRHSKYTVQGKLL